MYVPGVVKVCWNVFPVVRVPEVKVLSSEVMVCGAFPLFVQVIVSPVLMVSCFSR